MSTSEAGIVPKIEGPEYNSVRKIYTIVQWENEE